DALSEQCDDGNMVDEDGCTNACAINVCGDGVLYPEGAGGTEECDDGNTDAGDGCSDCKYEPRTVFVTSATYTGDFGNGGGLVGADARCQELAKNLGGTYKAWLSDRDNSAASRLGLENFHGPFQLVNGTKIADGWADLTQIPLLNAINVDETNTVVASVFVWTNTKSDGTVATMGSDANDCIKWSSIDEMKGGQGGYTGKTDAGWTDAAMFNVQSCGSTSGRLYCVQTQ
ncbi:MAG: DUF4215 domain-containing protein, partial [Nannocystaceae bacterium]